MKINHSFFLPTLLNRGSKLNQHTSGQSSHRENYTLNPGTEIEPTPAGLSSVIISTLPLGTTKSQQFFDLLWHDKLLLSFIQSFSVHKFSTHRIGPEIHYITINKPLEACGLTMGRPPNFDCQRRRRRSSSSLLGVNGHLCWTTCFEVQSRVCRSNTGGSTAAVQRNVVRLHAKHKIKFTIVTYWRASVPDGEVGAKEKPVLNCWAQFSFNFSRRHCQPE